MVTQLVRRIALLATALGVVWTSPIGVGTARADNLGGKFERCAQLVEFVAASGADPGHLTVVGIGPGLYNDISDTTTHRFPFSPDLVISDSLKSQLSALANGRRFTCLRMEGDGMGIVTQLAIHDATRQCGTVTRDADGIFAIDDERNFIHVELIAEAKQIVAANTFLRRLLVTTPSSPTCLVFHLASNGVARSITVDGQFGWCGPLVRSGSALRVGGITLADARSSTAELLPAKVVRAAYLLSTQDTAACGAAEIKASRFANASLTADGSICGAVRDADGTIRIGRHTIPNILDEIQASDLRAALGGSACLIVAIVENRLQTTLKTTPPAPASPSAAPSPTAAPTPTTEPSPSPSTAPTPSTTPTPTQVPVVPATVDGTPASSAGSLVGPLIIGLMTLLAVVAVGFLGLRRSRAGTPVPEPSAAPGVASQPSIEATETQPSVVLLTRREQEVLAMLYEGMSNKEIGSRLFISESTAGVHVSNIMAKLGARSRAEAATLALRMHLLTNDTFEH
jgi:DNA-binding CsgD family transcriptional regulator